MSNPLLTSTGLPPFQSISVDHMRPAVEKAAEDCRSKIEEVLAGNGEPTWNNTIAPIEEAEDRLSRIWSPINHMNSVVNSEELRKEHRSCLSLLSDYRTWSGQHIGLFKACQSIKASAHFRTLDRSKKKAVTDILQDFQLSGVGLPPLKRKMYGEISKQISDLSSSFSDNVLDATMGWSKQVSDVSDLSGVPDGTLALARATAESRGMSGYLITLEIPSYLPIITYCDNRELRKEIYEAYATRASDRGPSMKEWDNSGIINQLLQLRYKMAKMLGFKDHAEKSLVTKMAEDTSQVLTFLEKLAEKAKLKGTQEVQDLEDFALNHFGLTELAPWDITYYSEKQKKYLFKISDEDLRPYFPEDRVLSGLFKLLRLIFDITITEEADVDTWHHSVRFFNVFDSSHELQGGFYLDLHAREHKFSGAWMDECRGRYMRKDGQLQTPVAYLTCNFSRPVNNKPALFTHDEVITLFHEMGHGLHHILTRVNVRSVAGINGVPWDAVELPSQLLENWCWEEEVLLLISGHYETSEPLPKEMLQRLLKAKNFQSAISTLRQIELSFLDIRLHTNHGIDRYQEVQEKIVEEARSKFSVLPSPEWSRPCHSFSHIFSGGYDAGYYSYLWAQVLSSDAFSQFEESGILDTDVGQRFLKTVLEMGGSESPMELFQRFRGRPPKIDAFLRNSGILT